MTVIRFKNFINLTEEEKRLVLEWRNSDRVRLKMLNQEIIPLENHLKFIDSLKTRTECKYYMIYLDEKPVGVSDYVDMDEEGNSCINGVYTGDEKYGGFGLMFMYFSLCHAFENLKVKEFKSVVLNFNEESLRATDKMFPSETIITEDKKYYFWKIDQWEETKQKINQGITRPLIRNIKKFEVEE